mmetsp:Transcript_3864/g.5195  ORF Transcript_3864/g.5195 Transcript_3864/m.5195 type:complete len:308 (-) Transcript_3864:134-1057(-)
MCTSVNVGGTNKSDVEPHFERGGKLSGENPARRFGDTLNHNNHNNNSNPQSDPRILVRSMVYLILPLTLLLLSSAMTSSSQSITPPSITIGEETTFNPVLCANTKTHASFTIRLIASALSQNTNWALLRQEVHNENISFEDLKQRLPSYTTVVEPKRFEYNACMPRNECDGSDNSQELMLRIEGDDGGKFDFFQIFVDGVVHTTLRPANAGSVLIVRCDKELEEERSHEEFRSYSTESPLINTGVAVPPPVSARPLGWNLAVIRDDYSSDDGNMLKVEEGEILSRSSFWHEACMVDTLNCYFFYLHR